MMIDLPLDGKNILITGAARRLGRVFSLACARSGANIVIHHGHSEQEAKQLRSEIMDLGRRAFIVKADFRDIEQTVQVIPSSSEFGPLFALINSAAIFELVAARETTPTHWQEHININMTAPFLLSQAFAKQLPHGSRGHIINILDWRALRPGINFFPYTITKAALAAMTRSLAIEFAPDINVNGLALGAILPPDNRSITHDILKNVPAKRWANIEEVEHALLFLLRDSSYITGEIIHVDGGRHLI